MSLEPHHEIEPRTKMVRNIAICLCFSMALGSVVFAATYPGPEAAPRDLQGMAGRSSGLLGYEEKLAMERSAAPERSISKAEPPSVEHDVAPTNVADSSLKKLKAGHKRQVTKTSVREEAAKAKPQLAKACTKDCEVADPMVTMLSLGRANPPVVEISRPGDDDFSPIRAAAAVLSRVAATPKLAVDAGRHVFGLALPTD